jgi:hypothetical protein
MNTVPGRQAAFPTDAHYEAFLETLGEAHRRFGLEYHAYCLLKGGYHLLVKTPRGNLAQGLRHINALYTQKANQLKGRSGPVFKGRYKAVLVEGARYWLPLSRYIHGLPGAGRKPLAADPAAYPWSSLGVFLGKTKPAPWLVCDEIYGQLNAKRAKGRAYAAYMAEGVEEELQDFYARKSLLSVLGSDAFTKKAYGQKQKKKFSPSHARKGFSRAPISTIADAVAKAFKTDVREIYQAKRGSGHRHVPRWVAMHLCQDIASYSLKDIAKAFKINHVSGVSHQVRSLREEMAQDAKLARKVQKLVEKISKA